VAFTDRDHQVADQVSAGKPLRDKGQSAYLVPEWVRVRPEDFGLLFYDTRSTRLTFVRSGDRLVPPPFTGSPRVLSGVAPGGAGSTGAGPSPAALARLLDDLVAKGLLVVAEAE
jgi:putative mycofactocin binding protein MftB